MQTNITRPSGMSATHTVLYHFFLLSLVSDYAILGVKCTIAPVLCVPPLAALSAWLLWLVFRLISGRNSREEGSVRRIASSVYRWLVVVVLNLFILVDYFLLFKFNTLILQQSIDLFLGTNMGEAGEFVTSYISPAAVLVAVVGLIAVNVLACVGGRWLASATGLWRKTLTVAGAVLVVAGVSIFGYMGYNFVRYCHGAEIPTYTAPTRLGYGMLQRIQNNKRTQRLVQLCRDAEVGESREPDFDIVLILGESYSIFRSPVYGYDKASTPNQSGWQADSTLTVFEDVVTTEDWTQKVMMSILSTGRYNDSFGQHPLFPVLLRKAGWRTELYDNEFTVSHDTFFFNRADLSELMFDKRNGQKERYDAAIADQAVPGDSATFCMIHLMGQHFQYEDRYPAGTGRFTAGDYDSSKYTLPQRTIMAHYDNATLYNDSVVGSIVDRWSGRDCVMVYFSDHGEEVFECRDYFGHGNAVSAPKLDYQIRVPFMIWTSDSFRSSHPELQAAIEGAAAKRISTDDVAHFILDLAGVNTPELDPTRSFINPAYDDSRERMVLKSVNFDAQCR